MPAYIITTREIEEDQILTSILMFCVPNINVITNDANLLTIKFNSYTTQADIKQNSATPTRRTAKDVTIKNFVHLLTNTPK